MNLKWRCVGGPWRPEEGRWSAVEGFPVFPDASTPVIKFTPATPPATCHSPQGVPLATTLHPPELFCSFYKIMATNRIFVGDTTPGAYFFQPQIFFISFSSNCGLIIDWSLSWDQSRSQTVAGSTYLVGIAVSSYSSQPHQASFSLRFTLVSPKPRSRLSPAWVRFLLGLAWASF